MGDCWQCKFWTKDTEFVDGQVTAHTVGWCQRYAPAPLVVIGKKKTTKVLTVWPQTFSWDWCGEWQEDNK